MKNYYLQEVRRSTTTYRTSSSQHWITSKAMNGDERPTQHMKSYFW